MDDLYAGPGVCQDPHGQARALAVALVAAGEDADQLARQWTAIYDLLLLGRVRSAEEIEEYDEPPTL